MRRIYQMTSWQSGSGNWVCGDVSDLVHMSNAWWYPARILGVTPADFAYLLVKKYKVTNIKWNPKANLLLYSWKDQRLCNIFMNDINNEAKRIKFMI